MPKPASVQVKPNGSVIHPEAIYTVKEACRRLGWGRQALYNAVHQGRLPVIRGSLGWRFLGKDLLALAIPAANGGRYVGAP